MVRALALLATGIAVGCGREYGDEDAWICQYPTSEAGSCLSPLAEFCRQGPCPAYEAAVRDMEASVASYCREPLASLRTGTCGALRFTSTGHAYGSQTMYFDTEGRLVAASRSDDVPDGRGCFSKAYGFVPNCERQLTRDLCAR